MDHLAGNEPGITQQLRRVVGAPGRERVAHGAGRNAPAIVEHGRHNVDVEATQLALFLEIGRRARPRPAEMEIETDGGAGDGEPVDEHLFDELSGLQSRKCGVKLHHDRAVEFCRGQQPQLGGLVGQAKQRLVRIEVGTRMRLESQRCRRAQEGACAGHRRCNHRAMPTVHAFEIAYGEEGPAQLPGMGQRIERVMNCDEASRRRVG